MFNDMPTETVEIDQIPKNPYRLQIKIPRKNYIKELFTRIPGLKWTDKEEKNENVLEPWKKETAPLTGTFPRSQTPFLSILTTYYPIEFKFHNGCKKYLINPPPDIIVDKHDEKNLLFIGEIDEGHWNNRFHKIAKKIKNNHYTVPIAQYISGYQSVYDLVQNIYNWEFQPVVQTSQNAIDLVESFKKEVDKFRKGEHLIRGNITNLRFKRELREYQKTAVDFLEYNNGIGIIADEMGLGKTMMAICFAELIKAQKILVVCPANVKYTWNDEILITSLKPKKIKILEGRKTCKKPSSRIDGNERWVIINYDILKDRLNQLNLQSWDLIILDESHYIKNYEAKRSKATRKLIAPNRIALTGTPILNRPNEFWTTLSWLNPNEWGEEYRDYKEFVWKYGEDYYGRSKDENLLELRYRLKNIMLRRLKSEVEDLPPKIRQIRHVALSSKEMIEYRKKEKAIWKQIKPHLEQIDAKKQHVIFMALQTLRRYASLAKTPLTMEVMREVLKNNSKIVVFSEFLKTLDALQNVVEQEKYKTFRVDGSVTGEKRHEQVQGFQKFNGPAVFLGQIRASGIGITLHSASTVVFNDFAWNSATHRQAEDRIHRIGQKESCTIVYVSAKETIDESIIELLMKKIDVITTVLNEKEEIAEALHEILKKFEES